MANNVTITGIKYGTTTITASYTDGGKTVTASVNNFKVTAIAPTLTFTAGTNPTYNGSSQSLGKVSYNGDGTAYYYIQKATSQPAIPSASASGWTAISNGGTISATDAGTYYIFLKAVGKTGGNYTGVEPKVGDNNTINKRTVTVTTVPTYVSAGLTYDGTNNTNGSDQTLITAGACGTGGVMYYYVSTSPSTPSWNGGSDWSTSLPTGKDAGKYYVWYYCLVSDTNNNTAGTNTNAVKALANSPKNIARNPIASASPVTKLVYNGTTETNGTSQTGIKGSNVSWTGSTTGTNAGEYTASATPLSNFAWSDGTFAAKSITWSIARRGQTAPILQGATTTYPTTATATVKKKGTVAGGTADAPGELIWTNQSRSTAGSQTATAYYAATATNFSASPVSAGVDVKVNARTVTITAPTFNSNTLTYTGSGQTILNAGSCTTGGVMYYYMSTSSTKPSFGTSNWTTTAPTQKTSAGTYYVWYYCYVSDTTNNTGSGINTVTAVSGNSKTINQRKLTVTAASKSKEYDGSPLTINSATLSGHVSGHKLYSATYGGSQTTVGSSSSTVSDAVIKSGSTIVTDNYDITYANGTLTVTAASFTVSEPDQEYTYTGSPQGVAITVSELKGSQTATIKYRTASSGDYTLTDAPQITNVSQSPLTVYWQVTAPNHTTQTGSYTITIKKANATLPGTISGASVYFHDTARATVTKNYNGGTLQYTTDNGSTWNNVTWHDGNYTANPSRTAVGDTTVKFRVLGDGNHNNSSVSNAITLTVYQATDARMEVDIVTSTLTYNGTTCSNGTAQTIASVDSTKVHGVSSYSIGYKKGSEATADSQITWNNANTTPLEATDAGTYYVYYKFSADTDHSNSKAYTEVGSVTINPKAGSLTASVTNRTYNGTSGDNGTAQVIGSVSSSTGSYYLGLGSSTTSAPSSWGSANTSLSQINAGTYYVWAKCDASSNGNCAAVAAKYIGTATISPKTSTVTYSVNTTIEEFCILTATPASTWTRTDYHPEIATSSATGTGTGAITYKISQSGWSISSDGKTITIPSTAVANTYNVTVTATQEANGNWAEGSKSQTISVTLKANALERIELSLLATQIPFGGTTTGTVTAHYTNGADKDVTSSATYSSDPTGIVTITK